MRLQDSKLVLQNVKVFCEHWYGPFRNGDQLGGCAIQDSAFASTQALDPAQVIGVWEGKHAISSFHNSPQVSTNTSRISYLLNCVIISLKVNSWKFLELFAWRWELKPGPLACCNTIELSDHLVQKHKLLENTLSNYLIILCLNRIILLSSSWRMLSFCYLQSWLTLHDILSWALNVLRNRKQSKIIVIVVFPFPPCCFWCSIKNFIWQQIVDYNIHGLQVYQELSLRFLPYI